MKNIIIPKWRTAVVSYDGANQKPHPLSKQRVFSIDILNDYYRKNKPVRKKSDYFYIRDDTR